jgi:hypothetical protein
MFPTGNPSCNLNLPLALPDFLNILRVLRPRSSFVVSQSNHE